MDEQTKQVNRRNLAKAQDYHEVFESAAGQRVLFDMIDAHGLMSPNFHENGLVLACREGERMVVLRILQMLKVDPEKMKKLIEDAHEHTTSQNII